MEQNLQLFEDGSIIPEAILHSDKAHFALVTGSQATSGYWLLAALIENAMVGTAKSVNKELVARQPLRTCLVSTRNSKLFFEGLCRRNGLDLSQEHFTFVDCFTNLFLDLIDPAKPSLLKVFDLIRAEMHPETKFLLFDGPELLAPFGDLSAHLIKLTRTTKLTLAYLQDAPQVVAKLINRLSFVLQLNPLPTGRAQDITGSLSVCKSAPLTPPVQEREYVYFVEPTNINLYYR